MKKILTLMAAAVILAGGYYFFNPSNRIQNTSPRGSNIICFGDSLTYGTGASTGKSYPSQLSLLISKPVINAGIPGDTTATALSRIEKDVLTQSPRIVIITLGGNDLRYRVPINTFSDNLNRIIRLIQDQGALVVVGGIDIPLWGRGFGDVYEKICSQNGAILIPHILDGIFGRRELMSDPIHPNDEGYALMAKRFHKAIKPYM
ncbi:MAG: arylesterase [Thermodesulfobacteriota bacterium]